MSSWWDWLFGNSVSSAVKEDEFRPDTDILDMILKGNAKVAKVPSVEIKQTEKKDGFFNIQVQCCYCNGQHEHRAALGPNTLESLCDIGLYKVDLKLDQ